MELAHTELDLRKRCAIEDMFCAKMSVTDIAAAIVRQSSTVYREINHNGFEGDELPDSNGYYCVATQRTVGARRARRCELIRLEHLR